jgi:hypothetical protein
MVRHGYVDDGGMAGDGRGRLGKGAGRGKIWEKHESNGGDGSDKAHMEEASTVAFEWSILEFVPSTIQGERLACEKSTRATGEWDQAMGLMKHTWERRRQWLSNGALFVSF